jgi:hypothetical protein
MKGTSDYAEWHIIAWRLLWLVPFAALFYAACVLHSAMFLSRSPLFDEFRPL